MSLAFLIGISRLKPSFSHRRRKAGQRGLEAGFVFWQVRGSVVSLSLLTIIIFLDHPRYTTQVFMRNDVYNALQLLSSKAHRDALRSPFSAHQKQQRGSWILRETTKHSLAG